MSERRNHQQRTGRTPLTRRQKLVNTLSAPVLRLICRMLMRSYRLVEVHGHQHLDQLIEAERAALLCCWHQRLTYCVGWLLGARSRGLRPGFLVSPSRDGELVAAVVGQLGATVIRGSANRTGARAFRDMYTTLKTGVSPIIAVDGPHGPAFEVKSGTVMLAQVTKAPLVPISFSADRYWQLGSWDRTIIPKPFARVSVHIGAPIECRHGEDTEQQASLLGSRLEALSKTP